MFVESIFILETTHSWEIVQTNLSILSTQSEIQYLDKLIGQLYLFHAGSTVKYVLF